MENVRKGGEGKYLIKGIKSRDFFAKGEVHTHLAVPFRTNPLSCFELLVILANKT